MDVETRYAIAVEKFQSALLELGMADVEMREAQEARTAASTVALQEEYQEQYVDDGGYEDDGVYECQQGYYQQ